MAVAMPANATSFKKGQVNNPRGRPKALVDIQALARGDTKENLERLRYWRDQDVDPQVSLRAAIALHEIAWGKPCQALQHTGPDHGPLVISWVK